MAKERINMLYPKSHVFNLQESDIDKSMRLEQYFDEILGDESICIEDGEIKDRFDKLLGGFGKVIFFIGYCGTGKTFFIKRYFDIKANSPIIKDGCLIQPILGQGDSEKKTPYDKAADCVQGICDRLEYENPQLNELFTDRGIEDMFEFVLNTKANLLPDLDFVQMRNLSTIERKIARINQMKKDYPLGFQLIKLKYYFQKYHLDISRLVIVLDNLRNIYTDEKDQKEFLEFLINIYECLSSANMSCNKKLKIFLIIPVRPYEYRFYKTITRLQGHMTYKVWNSNKVNSSELFRKITGRQRETVTFDADSTSPESENFSRDLSELSQKFRCKYASMIEKLCFYDLSLILQAYKKILLNHTWVKEGKFRYMSDKGRENGLLFTNITCIRALACGEDKIYRRWDRIDELDEIDKLIPNILYNDENKDYALMNLYTMKYFLRKFNSAMEWGESFIVLEEYISCICELFGGYEKECTESLDYLFRREILRKSVHDVEGIAGEEYTADLGSKNKLYITSRGTKLWDMFKSDSVLLELCREDRYFEYGITDVSRKSSYDLMMEGKQHLLFIELLDLIHNLYEKELEFFQKACKNNRKEQYQQAFGKRPITLNLLGGVSKSILYSGCSNIIRNSNDLERYMISKWKEWGD